MILRRQGRGVLPGEETLSTATYVEAVWIWSRFPSYFLRQVGTCTLPHQGNHRRTVLQSFSWSVLKIDGALGEGCFQSVFVTNESTASAQVQMSQIHEVRKRCHVTSEFTAILQVKLGQIHETRERCHVA